MRKSAACPQVPLDASAQLRFESVVREHAAALLTLAVKLTGSAADGQDLLQDTLETVLRHVNALQCDGTEMAWLTTVLRHRAIDLFRRRWRSGALDEEALANQPTPEPYEEPFWASITLEQVSRAVARLPPDLRRTYELKVLDGRSYQEVGRELGIPTATVGTRLIRARRKLKALLMAEREGRSGLEATPQPGKGGGRVASRADSARWRAQSRRDAGGAGGAQVRSERTTRPPTPRA